MPTRIVTLTITEEPGLKPDVKIDAPGFGGPDLLWHLRNVVDIIHTQVLVQTVISQLAPKEPVILPGMVALPDAARPWPPRR